MVCYSSSLVRFFQPLTITVPIPTKSGMILKHHAYRSKERNGAILLNFTPGPMLTPSTNVSLSVPWYKFQIKHFFHLDFFHRPEKGCTLLVPAKDRSTDPLTNQQDSARDTVTTPNTCTQQCQSTVPPSNLLDSARDTVTTPSTSPQRYYLAHLLSCPDTVSSSEVFIINCHLQAIRSLVLK